MILVAADAVRLGLIVEQVVRARDGALEALAASRPGRRGKQRDIELEDARAEAERLRTALAEMAVRLTLAEGKEPWG